MDTILELVLTAFNDNISYILLKINIPQVDNLFEFIGKLVDTNHSLDVQLSASNHSISLLQNLIDINNNIEFQNNDKLFTKCAWVLNEKKRKIRDLMAIVKDLESRVQDHHSEKDDHSVDGDIEMSVNIEEKSSSPIKQSMDLDNQQDEDSEDDGKPKRNLLFSDE